MSARLATVLMVVVTFHSVPVFGQFRAEWEVHVGEKLVAPVVRGAAGPEPDTAWLATAGALYRVERGQPRLVTQNRSDGARLEFAPGGDVFAWVAATGTPRNPGARIEILRTSGEPISVIETSEAAGPDELILGYQGRLVLTFAPLDDPEGGRGRFRYTFWRLDGKRLASMTLDKAIPVLAADGSAIALLTSKDVRAYSATGELLWSAAGSFRKAALASGARRAALNPSNRRSLDAVVLVEGGEIRRTHRLPTAVHQLVISPEGDLVVVAGDRGRYFALERDRLREGRAIDAKRGTPYIFDLELAGRDAIMLGVLYRNDKQRPTWPAGSILSVTRAGTVVFRHDFAIRDATGFVPGIDVRWGDKDFVGYTRETAILGRLQRGR